jgi:hypothetical protein
MIETTKRILRPEDGAWTFLLRVGWAKAAETSAALHDAGAAVATRKTVPNAWARRRRHHRDR